MSRAVLGRVPPHPNNYKLAKFTSQIHLTFCAASVIINMLTTNNVQSERGIYMKRHTREDRIRLTESGQWLKATGSRKNLMQQNYYRMIEDLLELPEVQQLKQYRHHIMTTRFQHSLNVSYYNYKLCRMFRLDARSAARAGLLHDLYFYDTKQYTKSVHPLRHSHYHPALALENARMLIQVNDREQDMIEKHMWPVTAQRPSYAETYLITFVDKYCALIEFVLPQPRRFRNWICRLAASHV